MVFKNTCLSVAYRCFYYITCYFIFSTLQKHLKFQKKTVLIANFRTNILIYILKKDVPI